ncbi:MAG TPA: IclR family transcriptional regulator [Candidatus Eisenbacteria bacterium]|nr:IclR family transcriptional regulator [Candidatus Eisenbacteria bacterium]
MAERPEPPAGAIDRALAVLGVLAEASQPMGVTEIARRVGLPKSVVHYHVSALVRNRYVEARPDRRYGLGYAALKLGRGSYSNLEMRARALPHMRALHHDTWETVTLSALVGRERVYVDQLVSPQEIKLAVELGRPFPLHAGASGRAIMAFLPQDAREALLSEPLERLSPHTVVDPAALRSLLETVRESGLAFSRSERQEGAASVAAPVFDNHGVAGALSVCGPEYRFDDRSLERYGQLLKTAAIQLSHELGWR